MSGELADFTAGMLGGISTGTHIAGYRLEEQIGAGGMAVVFRAADERLGRLVALKLLAPSLAADKSFRQRFIHESQAAAAVNHPHIIPVYEAREAAGMLFIAMRYVSGRDVRELLSEGRPLPPSRAMTIISPVASALDAAHTAGLVHRDVKPANMLLDVGPGRPDHVYLSDFGLSKAALSTTGLTMTGHLLGTPSYMAPEQIDGRPVDGRADQYALACSAYEMLAGQPPFQRDDANAVIWAHLHAPPPRLTSKQADVPQAVDDVFARALAKSPADRYPRCADFAEALRAALGIGSYDPGAATAQATRQSAGDDLLAAGAAVPASAAAVQDRATELTFGAAELTLTAEQHPVPSPGDITPPRPGQPPLLPAGINQYGPPRPSRSRWPWLAAIIAAAVVATASGIGFALVSQHHRQTPPHPASPAQVARNYVNDINNRNWHLLWRLGGGKVVLTYRPDPRPMTYSQMVAAFKHTVSVTITSLASTGHTVTMYTSALNSSGVNQHYRLQLVVSHGRITAGSQYFLGS